MKAGSATLKAGGTMLGRLRVAEFIIKERMLRLGLHGRPCRVPGLLKATKRGRRLKVGEYKKVNAGDIVLIPADVAHTWTKVEKPWVYLDIKFPKAE